MSVTSLPSRLVFLMGVFAFTPSVALFHLGGSTGIQVFVALCVVLFFCLDVTLSRLEVLIVLALVLLIFAGMTEKFAFEKKIDMVFKGGISFLLNLFVMLVGILICRDKSLNFFDRYVDGYLLGAVLSSILSIIQFIFLFVLKLPSSLLLGPHNNRGFSDVTANANFDLTGYGRAFSLAPEPSVLALLLLPAAVIALWEGRHLLLFVILAGLYCTQSLTAVLFFLLSFVLYRVVSGKSGLLEYCLYGCIVILSGVVFGVFGQELFAAIALDGVLNRGAGGTDASSLSRLNSITSGISAIAEKPWLGWGVQSDGLKAFLLDRSTDLEDNDSINSLLLSLAAWFGLPFALILLVLSGAGLFFANDRRMALFVTVVVWPPFFLLNYYSLYSIWLCLGVSVWIFSQNIRSSAHD